MWDIVDSSIHLGQNIKNCIKTIWLMRILSSFFIPHLDCGDIFYDKLDNENFIKKEEKVQCKACLAITVVVVDVA